MLSKITSMPEVQALAIVMPILVLVVIDDLRYFRIRNHAVLALLALFGAFCIANGDFAMFKSNLVFGLLMFGVWPERLRMDVVSPFGVTLATLTSDGQKFALSDLREKRFYFGPASACNIARLTTVPMPGHVLVSLLRGEAPVLKHEAANATIEWSGKGYYIIRITSTRNAVEEIHLVPHPQDFAKPWDQQRLRVLDVEVKQEGVTLYHAMLDEHQPTAMAQPRVDPDGIDPPTPPSGPMCSAELPRKIHVEVPGKDEDVRFRYENVTWNPPIIEGLFGQPIPGGVEVVRVNCEKE